MLKEVDYQISVVIDTNTYKAIKCMNECNAQVSSDSLSDIGNNVTILFICVQDDIISSVADDLAKNENLNNLYEGCGALGRIRTPDPLIRSQVLYPIELRAPFTKCPRQDSNLYAVSGTGPSNQPVYQFQHVGPER